MISINSFPTDNKKRVVYLLGSLKLNTSTDSTNTLVDVLLVEISESNPNHLNFTVGSYDRYSVTFRDLDIVQIGSVWQGQNLIKDKSFNFNNRITRVNFTFDLLKDNPQIIKFNDKNPESDDNYIPPNSLFFPYKYNKEVNAYHPYPFLKSYYSILKSNDGIEVFISCVGALHSLFIPSRKEIRGYLIDDSYTFSKIVDKFFESYEIIEDNGKKRLLVKIKKSQVNNIGTEAIIFLANLALNPTTQDKVKKIRESLQDVILNKNNKPYPNRFPIVFPPHSQNLKFEAEGIWLEENKKFLVTRIKNVNPISDFPITIIKYDIQSEEVDDEEQKDEDEDTNESNGRKKKKTRIRTNADPSRKKGAIKKQTDILINLEESDIETIIETINTERVTEISNKKKNKKEKENSTEDVSSGNRYSNDKKKPKTIENSAKKSERSQINDLLLIFKALKEISKNKLNMLDNIMSINSFGKQQAVEDSYNLLQISSIVEAPVHTSWIHPKIGRSIMLLKLNFNRNSHTYLLDIKKNKDSESFCAFLFATNQELNKKQIEEICNALESKKGTKSWLDECEFIIKSQSINHIYTLQSEWSERFQTIFSKKKKKKTIQTAQIKVTA